MINHRFTGFMMKRVIDIVVAFLMLLILSPALILVAVLVKKKLGSPVLFNQTRTGINGTSFEIFKFRTMLDANGDDGLPLPDAQRMTKFGSFLRASSLDELPGLWNVLRGDMSLVGPRPLLPEYLPLYSPEENRRHEVRPGVTGWAQVNGRNSLSWQEKFKLDVWYVEHRSLWLDIKILFLTIKKVIAREGIGAEGEVTMSKFTGKN